MPSRSDLARALLGAVGSAALIATTASTAYLGADQAPTDAATARVPSEDLFRGGVEVLRADGFTPKVNEEGEPLLEGTVFEDKDRDGSQDRNEKGVAGVLVSNGRDVVETDGRGRYSVAAFENATVSITQPAGYQVPVDEDNVAQFFYHHLPAGSPEELRYGGLEPTGPLPSAVNFPLARSQATKSGEQSCGILGDLQTYNLAEVGYARDGAIKDLSERDDLAGCGALFIGDVVGDDLSLYTQVRDLTRQIDAPVRFLPGNHDLDFDASTAEHSFDTFRQQLAPQYYSYDVGQVHVVALNTVRYPCTPEVDNADGNRPQCNDPEGNPRYNGRVSDHQLQWLAADLAMVPEDKLVVVASHIPLLTFADEGSYIHQVDQVADIYELLEGRQAVAVSGHTHSVENMLAGDSIQGWNDTFGIEELPFHHLTSGAIAGDWYSGALTPDGYPVAVGRDGARPGVVTLDIDGTSYQERFSATGLAEEKQLNLGLNSPHYRDWYAAQRNDEEPELGDPNLVSRDDLAGTTWLTANFWMGTTEDTVTVSIDGGEAGEAQRTQAGEGEDQQIGAEFSDPWATRQQLVNGGSVADRSYHVWRYELPEDLAAGTHVATVEATDRHGRSFTETVSFTVVEER
jgi:hypothetical protein